jgi:hypothetical protein
VRDAGPSRPPGKLGLRADVAQLVEHHLAKVGVAGSNPVVRSNQRGPSGPLRLGGVAEWLGSGLQSRVHRFNSGPRLEFHHREGRLAQGESASLTRKRSEVQILQRPQQRPLVALTTATWGASMSYLPGGSARALAIMITAPEAAFERAVEAAAPVGGSVEFHAP